MTVYRLISRDSFPPGGWKFFQPETGWWAPAPNETSFDRTAVQIYNHRQLNKSFQFSLDLDSIEWELENFTALRLKHNPRYVSSYDPETQTAQIANAPRRKTRGCGSCGSR